MKNNRAQDMYIVQIDVEYSEGKMDVEAVLCVSLTSDAIEHKKQETLSLNTIAWQ